MRKPRWRTHFAIGAGWIEGENNHPGVNMILLTQNSPGLKHDGTALAAVQQGKAGSTV